MDAAPGSGVTQASAVGSRIRDLVGHTAAYGLGTVGSGVLGILLLPLYTHSVTRSEMGSVELINASVAVGSIALSLGLFVAFPRSYFESDSEERRLKVVASAMFTVLSFAGLAVIMCALARAQLSAILAVPTNLFSIGIIGLWFSMAFSMLTTIYRVRGESRHFAAFALLNVVLSGSAICILVGVLDMRATGILVGSFSGYLVSVPLLFGLHRRYLHPRACDISIARSMLGFGLPFVPLSTCLWALNVADRYQVGRLGSKAQLGTYSAAGRLALGMMLLVTAFQMAWPVFAHSLAEDQQARGVYRQVLSYWTIVMSWGFVALSTLAPVYIESTMPPQWHGAAGVVPFLAAGCVLYGAFQIVATASQRVKRTRLLPVIGVVAAASNLGLNFLLIPSVGIIGAGASTVVGYAILFGLAYMYANAAFPIRYDWAKVLRIACAAVVFVILVNVSLQPTGVFAVIGRLAFTLAFPAVVLLVGGATEQERAAARAWMAERRAR